MARTLGRKIFFTLLAGAAGAALVPVIRPVVAGKIRPAAKGAIRAGLLMFNEAREKLSELAEITSDLVAEVQSETEHAEAPAAGPEESEQVVPFEMKAASGEERKLHA
jgi:hypothetical protein